MKAFFILFFFTFSFLNLNGQEFDSKLIKSLSKGGNNKRFKTIRKHILSDTLLVNFYNKENVDWLGIYKNIVVNIPGKTDSIIYVTSHYDKVDGNIVSTANRLVNGWFDFLLSPTYFSKGTYDNGSGVITALRLMKIMASKENKYSYTFLFTALEEYGLRGARTHVSKLSKDKYNKIKYVINIDMIGGGFNNNQIGVTEDVSDLFLLNLVKKITENKELSLYLDKIEGTGKISDFEAFTGTSFGKDFTRSLSFNFIGALFPQRSYFTCKKTSIPLISFSDKLEVSSDEVFSAFSPFAFGRIHSFKDNDKVLNIRHLDKYYIVIADLIKKIENNKK